MRVSFFFLYVYAYVYVSFAPRNVDTIWEGMYYQIFKN